MRKATVIQLLLPCLLTGSASVFAQESSVYTPAAYSSSSNMGASIRTWTTVRPETNPNNITTSSNIQDFPLMTQYLDGLGRPVQSIVKHGSQPTGGTTYDLLSANVYDEYGKEARIYLPFAGTASSGNFQTNPFQQQSSFYSGAGSPIYGQGEAYFYGKTEYEESPLGRVRKTFSPGDNWVHGGKGTQLHYWNNTASDSVRIWTVTENSGSFGSYTSSRMYATGTLFKSILIDERNNQVVEFKDKQGNVILNKVQLTAQSDTGQGTGHYGWLCTYYIYDAANRLRAVIQPVGVELLMQHSWDLTWNSSVILNEQSFCYEYDEIGRVIMKKMPGVIPAEMVYDARNRLVLSRDGNMTSNGKWLYIQYDELNRPVVTGLWTNSSSRTTHQSSAGGSTSYPNLSGQTYEQLTETHYDDYNSLPSGLSSSLINTWINSTNFITSGYNSSPDYVQEIVQTNRTQGMITWAKAKVLGTSSQFVSTTNIYDDKGRAVQVQHVNQTNGLDVTTMQYDFAGKMLRSHIRHQAIFSSTRNYEIGAKNTYDNLGRVTKTEKQLNGSGWKTISQLEYDAIGQLKKKKLGTDPDNTSNPLETLNYAFNIRGWLLGMNRDYAKDNNNVSNFFGFDLGYDKQTIQATGQSSIGNYAAAMFNGNIAGAVWKTKGDPVIRKFDFSYDTVNRLMKADFAQLENSSFTSSNVNFTVKMGDGSNPLSAYDANGNIRRMQQWGLKPGGSSQIDDLNYTYYDYSNKLKNVIDNQNDTATRLGDFRSSKLYIDWLGSKNTSATDYTYDDNGNMLKDLNKDIVTYSGGNGIVYNFLNLPQTITVKKDGSNNRGTIECTYDAAGNKLKKVVTEGSTVTTTLYMIGTYVNDTLQYISHEEGRIRYKPQDNSYVYDYFLKDHLNNIRMVLTEEEQLDQYSSVTFEDANTTGEQQYYENADIERTSRPGAFNSNTTNGDKVQLLRKSTHSIGAGKLLKVMAGDLIHTKVDYYIPNDATDNGSADGLNALLTQLTGLLNATGAPAALKGSGSTITGVLNSQSVFTSFMSPQSGSGGTMPKAYLNILFFDEQFKFVSLNSESVQVTTKGSGQQLQRISSNAKEAPQNGYVYIYISNESNNLVYFDNLQISHERGRILEETHYYAFGLTMAGISSKALGKMVNSFKFNGGTEHVDDLSVYLYATENRGYDAQIGRFGQIDPMADWYVGWSPYNFALDNPIYWNDPSGLEPDPPQFNNVQELIDYINQYGIGGLPDGFMRWVFGDNGNIQSFVYDPDPYLGYNSKGIYGLWINYSGWIENGYSISFGNAVMNEVVVGTKFIAANNFISGWNSYQTEQNTLNSFGNINFGLGFSAPFEKSFEFANSISNNRVNPTIEMLTTDLKISNGIYKAAKVAKGLGYAGTAIGVITAGYQLIEKPTAGNATRLAVQGIAIAANFIPVAGWAVSLGIGIADYIWGDDLYSWIDNL